MRSLLFSLLFISGTLPAVTLTVDTTADVGSGLCTAAPNDCTLRGALLRLDGISVGHDVHFNIPLTDPGCVSATGVCTIAVQSALPDINPNNNGIVLIDGYTQPGALPNTLTPAQGGSNAQLKIVINGSGCAGGCKGLSFVRNGTVRGLVLNGFGGGNAAVSFAIGDGGGVEGCFLGTDASGMVAVPNGFGVITQGNPFGGGATSNVRIGGTLPAQRNVISASSSTGINLDGAGHSVLGNLIGTNAAGTAALGNNVGIRLGGGVGFFQLVGNVDVGSRNVISGNGRGIVLGGAGPMNGTRIRGNFIGTDVSGNLPLGNSTVGIEISINTNGVQPAMVGGSVSGEGNIVAFNGTQGVATRNSAGQVIGNRIFRNGQLGISGNTGDNGTAGSRSANDPGDPDATSNKGQNFPEIDSVGFVANQIVVGYRVDSTTINSTYPLRVEFFRADGDEGSEFLGAQSYTSADAQLAKTVNLAQPIPPITLNDVIVATATDVEGNTSEFSFSPTTLGIDNPTASACISNDSIYCNGFESGTPAALRIRVNALAAGGAFRPNGTVNVSDDRGHSCTLNLLPTATPLGSAGECFLIGSGASGPIAISAVLDTFKSAFGSATGGNATASANFILP